MDLRVDRERCIGAGMCVLTAPEVFDQGEDDGLVLLVESPPAPEHEAGAREATRVCPSGAIWVDAHDTP